jgi:signal transduction histidine kinase
LSGEEKRLLVEEQAALRRVATMVARGTPPAEVFATVTEEIGQLLALDFAYMGRFEPDSVLTTVAAWGGASDVIQPGARWTLGGKNISTLVSETGHAVRIDRYADASGPVGAEGRENGFRSAVGTPVIVEGRMWGVIAGASALEETLPTDTEARLASFTELVATAIANAESRAALARLAEEQAALRRVATLVAHGTPPEKLFAAVTEEVGHLLPVDSVNMCRYEPDRTQTFVATWGETRERFAVGSRWPLGGHNLGTLVFETGRPARVDRYADGPPGPLDAAAREVGIRSAVGTPIVVEGRLWGVIGAGSSLEQPLPADTEARLASLTELVATAIANTESHAALTRLAEEQAALLRVATLVARGVAADELFAAVTSEVGRLLGAHLAGMGRYGSDDTVTVVAAWGAEGVEHPMVPGPWPLEGDDLASIVFRTGQPVRIDDYHSVPGPIAVFVREELGVDASVASPIVVEGRLWGVLFLHARQTRQPFPHDAESRLTGFTELVATAIANAESRSELAASRRRIVAASDQARRRIERDLHDGTQQRLISLALAARTAEADAAAGRGDPATHLSRITAGLADAVTELQELARGIHPAALSERGLGPALRALARRSAVPVDLDVSTSARCPEPVEVAAYYVASEALANAMKHAQASRVEISLAMRDGRLLLSVRDDGVGGADPGRGSGLVGLTDRVEALGGSIRVHSAAGTGTHITVDLPLEHELAQGIS